MAHLNGGSHAAPPGSNHMGLSRPRHGLNGHDPSSLEHSATHLNLAAPVGGGDRKQYRESTIDSAGQAEGIFDLYERDRDSWMEKGPSPAIHPLAMTRTVLDGIDGGTNGVREELAKGAQPPDSPASWEGPMAAFNVEQRQRKSSGVCVPTPPITLTPDISPVKKKVNQHQNRHHPRNSALASSTSTAGSLGPSASHPSISRLSPYLPDASGSSANNSQISIAESSQYPGEDNDAFHVRSTYARLEAEGVHGDGWDPGVERTRGGPSVGKRATVLEANKIGDVGEAERGFLANLDRYGFVNEPLRNRSETRLALIPTSPLLKVPKLPHKSPIPPGQVFQTPSAFSLNAVPDGPAPKTPDSPKLDHNEDNKARRKESERVGKWMKMMSVNGRDSGGNTTEWAWRKDAEQKLLRRVYKGIPDRWRMAAWWTLAEERARDKGKGRERRPMDALVDDYRHRVDLPSTHDVQIDLDVPRTISGHTLFVTRYGTGQRSLFHVLHAFSLLCESCGYCQGMGPIAATLLCYFDPERVYSLLVRLHDVYGMHSIFGPGFPGLLEAFYVQERLMEYLMPEVYKSFQRNMISSSAWGTKWYITLFVNTVPFSQQLRLWDVLWYDGRDVMVMTSIAILWAFKDLLSAPTANFESILSLLSSYFVAEDENALMDWIRRMLDQQPLRRKMDGWRNEWLTLVAQGKSGTALL